MLLLDVHEQLQSASARLHTTATASQLQATVALVVSLHSGPVVAYTVASQQAAEVPNIDRLLSRELCRVMTLFEYSKLVVAEIFHYMITKLSVAVFH